MMHDPTRRHTGVRNRRTSAGLRPDRARSCTQAAKPAQEAERSMSWSNRVVWREGMFLRTQHFQQQDRWTESLVRGVTRALRPHPWGLVDYTVDRDLLGTGRFALSSASGMFEDGTPFLLPGEADHPPPLDVPDSARNAL